MALNGKNCSIFVTFSDLLFPIVCISQTQIESCYDCNKIKIAIYTYPVHKNVIFLLFPSPREI